MVNTANFKILLLVGSLSIFFVLNGYAQTKTVTGKCQIRVEPYLSQIETEEKAIEQAKINAIKDVFGEYVEQESKMGIEAGKVDFHSYGQTKVKGEWVQTIGEPEFSYDWRKNEKGKPETWITCKIKGKIRKAIPKADVQVKMLSCPLKNCSTDEFEDEQNMFLYVKSPVDGYLSVFLDDGTTVYRLLPYRRMGTQESVKIEGDKTYILFSREIENFGVLADRIELFTNKDEERNTL